MRICLHGVLLISYSDKEENDQNIVEKECEVGLEKKKGLIISNECPLLMSEGLQVLI